jgi:hypothetical protein
MKLFLKLFLFFIFSISAHAANIQNGELVGRWKFNSLIYRGEERPPFNPHLNLYFEFYETGTNRLMWNRNNEEGFCERFGFYKLSENKLIDEVVWVNPNNSQDCSKDTDMQLGRKSSTPIELKNGNLQLKFYIGDEPLIYIFERVIPSNH